MNTFGSLHNFLTKQFSFHHLSIYIKKRKLNCEREIFTSRRDALIKLDKYLIHKFHACVQAYTHTHKHYALIYQQFHDNHVVVALITLGNHLKFFVSPHYGAHAVFHPFRYQRDDQVFFVKIFQGLKINKNNFCSKIWRNKQNYHPTSLADSFTFFKIYTNLTSNDE